MDITQRLLAWPEPAIRWKTLVHVLGEPLGSSQALAAQEEVRRSERVRRLLAPTLAADHPPPYAKWQGAHWVLATLADLGYPSGDAALHPLREQVLRGWLDPGFRIETAVATKAAAYGVPGVPVIDGRHRAHGSQQGNALWFLEQLGIADARSDDLADLLLRWQWPDGGWNCDKDPTADTSSFMETLLPMVGLHARGLVEPARRAAEVFLTRGVTYRAGTHELIKTDFGRLHYPLYWHYDVLAGLKGLARLDLLRDPRCTDALDLLESLRLDDGGWPAQARHYRRVSDEVGLHNEWVDWGGTSQRRSNPWVTVDALAVLRRAGRST